MKKSALIFSIFAMVMLFSSIGLAAPVMDFQAWQMDLGIGGINYDDMDFWGTGDDSTELVNFYLRIGLTDRLAVGIDSFHFGSLSESYGYWSELTIMKNYTDVKAAYKIVPNLQLFGGARIYSSEYYRNYGQPWEQKYTETDTEPLYGAGVTIPLGDTFHAFASWQKSDIIKETQAGLMYQNESFGVYATVNRMDVNGSKYDGAGLGLNFRM
ncbi:outer membrane beta-barrel protein [Acetonema longum]|uniref:Outer membrane protein beta-barrel domain-containing protein n=1 Tax=Acetonema longum DSM 6540 TaxID=1009370 RepID=F7NHH4_9FIRM|nr:outer membrane beta-barrel protein [Acetonema longum]EGO64521.1 hypothetical protein ALO_07608 [Acetonema longum DSM 6540]